MVPQQVVPGQAESADGRLDVDTGVWTASMIPVEPVPELLGTLGGGAVVWAKAHSHSTVWMRRLILPLAGRTLDIFTGALVCKPVVKSLSVVR